MNNQLPIHNSRIIKVYLEYLSRYYPNLNIDAILQYAGMTKHQIEDPGHWFSQHQVERFQEILGSKTGNSNIPREAGRYAVSSEALGAGKQYALGLLSLTSVYLLMERLYPIMSRGATINAKKIGHDRVEIVSTPKPGFNEKPFQCENRIGTFESMGKLFTKRFAKVEHPSCFHKGDDCCRYIITWEKISSLIWKRIKNYCILISILLSLVLFFVLPTLPWVLLVLLCALFTITSILYSGHLEKKDLIRTIETLGDAAKDHLDEINIRYNNALLIQEIGQATSMILDIDELVTTVVNLMGKHLDFDRGMIMLANKQKTRLVYTGGFGYGKKHEDILRQTEFHLDNPASRGVFVVSFKEQKPFLLNDISENGKLFSKRSLELAERMGVKSIICVPITYEKKSLGILAVDNIKSKRPLTQTDMSLLMGVASQTAANIVETISFQKLQDSEKKYRDLVENANSIILRRDVNGNITFFNEFAQRFFGYKEDEILGKNILGTIITETESVKDNLLNLSKVLQQEPEKQVVSEDENILRKGETAFIAWTYKPIFDNDGQLTEILCIGNDITDLRRAAQEKKALEAQLQEAQKMEAIGTLAGGIAHDFNNILQAIIGYTQIILLRKKIGDPDCDNLEEIKLSAQRASDLTNRLLIFGRKVESKLIPVDLNQEVVHVSKMLERTIPKMISIELKLEENLRIINADPVQTEQVMMNIGVNSRDAMPDGGKLVFETKNITLDEGACEKYLGCTPGDYVLLRISDTGHGMNKELREHIFEPFFTTKETGKGTGLGLAMVYGIIKSHAGFITCESEPGSGTTFKIYFPVLENKIKDQWTENAEAALEGGCETILLVDDEKSIRESGAEVLSHYGYTVMMASDGESALELYRKENDQIDLIILDLSMPGMGGKKCLEEILKFDTQAKVIIATGYSVNGPTKEAINEGAKAFICKPYEISEILKVVRDALDETSNDI